MAKRAHQKLKLLALKPLLEQQTDERHTMTAAEMIAGLSRWGITAERKSIYDDLEALREFGMDIQCHKGKQGGWFLWGARLRTARAEAAGWMRCRPPNSSPGERAAPHSRLRRLDQQSRRRRTAAGQRGSSGQV